MEYRNLDLEAFDYRKEDDGEHFRVRVTGSPAGEQRHSDAEEVTIPLDLRKRLRWLERRKRDLPGMIALGESLADQLFPPRVREFLRLSRAHLDDDEGLRIRLRMHTYALADLPWEYVYIARPDTPPGQKGVDGFLALDRRVSLVRYEVMGQAPGSLDPIGAGPLRMVTFLSNPVGTVALDLAAERQTIEQALGGVPSISVEFYPEATVEKLEDALVRPAHIFHFAGHGKFEGNLGVTFGSMEGRGYLVLVDDAGQEMLFPAEKLALSLRGRGVRLAVLGACEGGRRDQVNAWTGIVPALTRAGIPAVVGMQYKILDRNAIAFSRIFYRALAAGQSIDTAVSDGRLAIFSRSGDDERDWGVPVLYLRTDEGVLFPSAQPERPAETREKGLEESVKPVVTPSAEGVDKRILREAMFEHFGMADLEALCDDVEGALEDAGIEVQGRPMQVNLEIVGGSGKRAKVLRLIQYLDRRGYLGHLVKAVLDARPDEIALDDIVRSDSRAGA